MDGINGLGSLYGISGAPQIGGFTLPTAPPQGDPSQAAGSQAAALQAFMAQSLLQPAQSLGDAWNSVAGGSPTGAVGGAGKPHHAHHGHHHKKAGGDHDGGGGKHAQAAQQGAPAV